MENTVVGKSDCDTDPQRLRMLIRSNLALAREGFTASGFAQATPGQAEGNRAKEGQTGKSGWRRSGFFRAMPSHLFHRRPRRCRPTWRGADTGILRGCAAREAPPRQVGFHRRGNRAKEGRTSFSG